MPSFRRILAKLLRHTSTVPASNAPADTQQENNENTPEAGPREVTSLEGQAITHAAQIGIALASPVERPQSPIDPDRKPQKKALLIGICCAPDPPECRKDRRALMKKTKKRQSTAGRLKGPHKDVEATKKLLIEKYKYRTDDIVTLVDTEEQPKDLLPTKDNILKHIGLLIKWAKAGDRFYFHFSGHSGQIPTTDWKEDDLMDEYICTCDGQEIMDDVLREELVDPLPKGANLTVVFDSCTSGTLLDLDHWRCNQVYVPWVNKGSRKTRSLWIITRRRLAAFGLGLFHLAGISSSQSSQRHDSANASGQKGSANGSHENGRSMSLEGNQREVVQSPFHGLERTHSPEPMHCNGYCPRKCVPWKRNNVICLSSAADGQKTYEDGNGTSMTTTLIELLEEEPHPTLSRVLTMVSFELHQKYTYLHVQSRAYRKEVREFNDSRRARGKAPRDGTAVEMNNFQTPQLSSHQPLDMTLLWNP